MAEQHLTMGAQLVAGATRFRVWAPRASRVDLEIVGAPSRIAMTRGAGDVFETCVQNVGAGADYYFVLDGDKRRPDPRSRWQPGGVHGPSRVVAGDGFAWSDDAFRGPDPGTLVIYELHVGTFTAEGTFEAIVPKLPYLASVGVTAIELMPVAEFPGARNWGYDGVHLYAPQTSYGGPEGLKRLIDAAHRHGIAVVLDVVYNHLGPEGNYLADFGPYFTGRYGTPWGQALNLDGPDSDEVRRYLRDNALYWLTDFHVDALRLDAIHAIFDMSAQHFLKETADAFHAKARELGRRALLVAESDLNDVRVIQPTDKNGYDFDAQWNDDFHHAVIGAVTGTRHGYFEDFGAMADVAKATREGFVYDGRASAYRKRRHGNSAVAEPGHKFIVFLQNHDQVANAWHNRRLSQIASPERQRAVTALLFAQPGIPMLFMGQEFGEIAPFDFFTSHSDPELAEAVRRGRREEHRSMGLTDPADPQAESTFLASKLDWSLTGAPFHREMLALHRDLIALRRRHPALSNGRRDLTTVESNESPRWMSVERRDERGGGVVVIVNFEDETRNIPFPKSSKRWRLALDTSQTRYGGSTAAQSAPAEVDGSGQGDGDGRLRVACPGPGALIYTTGSSPS